MAAKRCTVRQVKLTENAIILVVDAEDEGAPARHLRLRQSFIEAGDLAREREGRFQVAEVQCEIAKASGTFLSLHFARVVPGAVLRSIEVIADAPLLLDIDPRTQLSMTLAFPLDDDEFSKAFSSRKTRWQDNVSNYLVAQQICRHFPGSPAFRCAAGVVLCYQAAEIGDAGIGLEALAIARELLPLADACPRHWHPRRNGEQLGVSLLMAMWHVHLSMNDEVSFRAALDGLVERHSTITNYLTPSNAMCRSFLLYGFFHLRKGETERARSLFRLTIEAFQRGAADIGNGRISFLRDLEASHRAAVLAAEASRSKHGGKEIDGDAILTECLRVGGKARNRLMKNFNFVSSALTAAPTVHT